MTDATETVNNIARALHAKMNAAGHSISEKEAQAMSVIGLMAAAEVNSGREMDEALKSEGAALVSRILA